MTLQQRVFSDMERTTDKITKETLRLVKAELQRGTTKDFSDPEVADMLKHFIGLERKRLKYVSGEEAEKSNASIQILESYLPKLAELTDDEIQAFIATIDFSAFKNRVDAMSVIMKHFGPRANGKRIRGILMAG